MRSIFNVLLVLATLLPALMLSSAPVQAQNSKIGFINDDLIKESDPEWNRAQEQMNIEIKAWDDEALAKQTELEELAAEYEKQKLILSDEKRREREAAIRAKQLKRGANAFLDKDTNKEVVIESLESKS